MLILTCGHSRSGFGDSGAFQITITLFSFGIPSRLFRILKSFSTRRCVSITIVNSSFAKLSSLALLVSLLRFPRFLVLSCSTEFEGRVRFGRGKLFHDFVGNFVTMGSRGSIWTVRTAVDLDFSRDGILTSGSYASVWARVWNKSWWIFNLVSSFVILHQNWIA